MSRYIDADAMKEWLDEYLSVFKKYDKSEVKGFVEHQPSIEIVRCAECKCWSVKHARPRTVRKNRTTQRCRKSRQVRKGVANDTSIRL